jgi:hypothetical protein
MSIPLTDTFSSRNMSIPLTDTFSTPFPFLFFSFSFRHLFMVPQQPTASGCTGDRLQPRNGPEKRIQGHKMSWFSAYPFAMQRAVWATVSSESAPISASSAAFEWEFPSEWRSGVQIRPALPHFPVVSALF